MLTDINIMRWLLACLIIGLLMGSFALLLYWLRHRRGSFDLGFKGAERRLRLLDKLVIDNRHKVLLLEADGATHTVIVGGDMPLVLKAHKDKKHQTDPKKETPA